MHRPSLLLAFAIIPLVGCAEGAAPTSGAFEARSAAPMTLPAGKYMEQPTAPAPGSALMEVAGADQAAPAEGQPPPPTNAAGISRKVIYDATLDLIVKNVDQAIARVGQLVEQSGGYIAEQDMVGSPGETRSQRWKIRIPIERFESFVAGASALGELERFNRKSQDVTAEFYDVDARVKNKKVEEETLQKLLDERSGTLEDVLKVETELSRVRGEIEQLQGRLRVLENLSALATLTLNVRERETFEPPAPVVADFPTQISRVWGDSVRNLVDLGKGITLFLVGQVVWLPFWIVGLLLVWIAARKLYSLARLPIHVSVGNPPRAGEGEGSPSP